MMLAQTWQGGYVQHGDEPETIIYHRSYEEQNSACGCGCGCGSESGSGCGCGSGGGGLIAGYDTFRPMGFGVGWNIVVEWGEGNFSGTSQPTVSAALQIPGTNQALALNASWDGCYRVRITGTIKQVGEESGITVYTYNLTEYYNIPGFYHN